MRRPFIIAGALLVTTIASVGSAWAFNRGLARMMAVPEGVVLKGPEELGKVQAGGGAVAGSPDGGGGGAQRPRSRKEYIDGILRRNIFDHDFIATYAPNPNAGAGPDGGPALAITDLKARLLGTLVSEPIEASTALIADDQKDGIAFGYSLGDKFYDAEIVSIEVKKVGLKRGDGRIEYLTADMPGTPTAAASAGPAAGGESGTPTAEGIEKVSDTKFIVQKDMLMKYVLDPSLAEGLGRALTHRGADGEVDGYRLSSIRKGSPLEALGLKNGDVLHMANGVSAANEAGLAGLSSQLLGGGNISLEITRRGQKQTMEYELR